MQNSKEQQTDNKAFLSDQCKEIEEKNKMEKTRDLFKKIRDTKGTFHAKMGTGKDRNGMDLTEAHVLGNKLIQKDNADSEVQFTTLAGPRQSLLLAKDPDQHL